MHLFVTLITFGWMIVVMPKYNALPRTTSRHYISYGQEQEIIRRTELRKTKRRD